MEQLVADFKHALLCIDRFKAAEIFHDCFQKTESFEELEIVAINSLEQIGAEWENGQVSLAQVYMSGIICEELIEKYIPMNKLKRKDSPKIAIGVLQDHHALGKRIVYSVLRASGYELDDFGHGLSVAEIVKKTIDNGIEILMISTLMLASALKVKEVKEELRAKGCGSKIIVGGAPFRLDPSLWINVGADADGKNASDVINTIKRVAGGVNG
ncbi:MAG: cobalamin-dependent protein [Lachnospiraceae bacterium]|nr:cobalamin-dependent protein [Lachnospiraceae bacterium]